MDGYQSSTTPSSSILNVYRELSLVPDLGRMLSRNPTFVYFKFLYLKSSVVPNFPVSPTLLSLEVWNLWLLRPYKSFFSFIKEFSLMKSKVPRKVAPMYFSLSKVFSPPLCVCVCMHLCMCVCVCVDMLTESYLHVRHLSQAHIPLFYFCVSVFVETRGQYLVFSSIALHTIITITTNTIVVIIIITSSATEPGAHQASKP